MTKPQIQILVILAGMILIGVVLKNQLAGRSKPAKEPAGAPPAVSALGGGAEIKFTLPPLSGDVVRKQKLGLQLLWKRNPFVLKSQATQNAPQESSPLVGLFVSAVIMKGDTGTAMVNDGIVHAGDTLRGYKVVKIDTSGIVLEKDGQTEVIPYGK